LLAFKSGVKRISRPPLDRTQQIGHINSVPLKKRPQFTETLKTP
jgi:hypothetical protein